MCENKINFLIHYYLSLDPIVGNTYSMLRREVKELE